MIIIDNRVSELLRLVADIINRLRRDNAFLQSEALRHGPRYHISDNDFHRNHARFSAQLLRVGKFLNEMHRNAGICQNLGKH